MIVITFQVRGLLALTWKGKFDVFSANFKIGLVIRFSLSRHFLQNPEFIYLPLKKCNIRELFEYFESMKCYLRYLNN